MPMPARASASDSVLLLFVNTVSKGSNVYIFAGIAMPARASAFNSKYTLVNAEEALTGFEPKSLLEACS